MIKTNHVLITDNQGNFYGELKKNKKQGESRSLGFFGGKVETFDRDNLSGLLRELQEETGMNFSNNRLEFLYSDIKDNFHGNVFKLVLKDKVEVHKTLSLKSSICKKYGEINQSELLFPQLINTILKYG